MLFFQNIHSKNRNRHSSSHFPSASELTNFYQTMDNISSIKRIILPLQLIFVIIGTDQCTKFLASSLLATSNESSFFYNFITFSLIQNYGGFLGVVNTFSLNVRFFLLNICVSLLLLGCLAYLFGYKKSTTRYDMPLALVCGGGMSNLFDRLLHNGGVTDFLCIGIGTLRTGIFNLADVYILIGSFILGYSLFPSPANTANTPSTES